MYHEENEEFETDYTEDVICPWCGWEHNILNNEDLFEGDINGIQYCNKCEKPFYADSNYVVFYSTQKSFPCVNYEKCGNYNSSENKICEYCICKALYEKEKEAKNEQNT